MGLGLGMELDLLEEDQGPGLPLLLEQISATPPAAQIAQLYRHSGLQIQENRRDVYAVSVYITCQHWVASMESAEVQHEQ